MRGGGSGGGGGACGVSAAKSEDAGPTPRGRGGVGMGGTATHLARRGPLGADRREDGGGVNVSGGRATRDEQREREKEGGGKLHGER